MDALTPLPDFAAMSTAIAAAGREAMNPDAGNRQALFVQAGSAGRTAQHSGGSGSDPRASGAAAAALAPSRRADQIVCRQATHPAIGRMSHQSAPAGSGITKEKHMTTVTDTTDGARTAELEDKVADGVHDIRGH